MRIDLSIDPIGHDAGDIVQAALAAEECGFHGVALPDELCDFTGTGLWSHEPWTLMSAIAARTSTIEIGSLVLNIANRDAGTLAVAAATLQQLSHGRLWLGLGAGMGATSEFATDQRFFGRTPPGAARRRDLLRHYVAELHRVWDGGPEGFLRPSPVPAIVIGAFGPKTAALAGRVADGVACPMSAFGGHGEGIERLVEIARTEFAAADRPGRLEVVAHYELDDSLLHERWTTGSPVYERLARLGVDRLVLYATPSVDDIREAARRIPLDQLTR